MTHILQVGVCMCEIYSSKVLMGPKSTISGVLLYAENDSDKISDRLDTLKGRFQRFENRARIAQVRCKITQVPPTPSKPTPFDQKLNYLQISIGDVVMMTHYDSILDINNDKIQHFFHKMLIFYCFPPRSHLFLFLGSIEKSLSFNLVPKKSMRPLAARSTADFEK